MGLLELLMALVVVGVVLYLVQTDPIAERPIKRRVQGAVLVILLLWLARGLLGDIRLS
jgi:hypothetical protein